MFVETWLTESTVDTEVKLSGYKFIRKDRTWKRGGGIICYFKEEVQVNNLSNDRNNGEELDLMWFELKKENAKYLFCICYRPPNNGKTRDGLLLDNLREGFKQANSRGYEEFFLIGDFNLPDIDWELLVYNPTSDSFRNLFVKFLLDNFLYQHISENTRTRGQSISLVDLVISQGRGKISEIRVGAPLGKSDHCSIGIIFDFKPKTEIDYTKKFINFKGGDYRCINSELNLLELRTVFNDIENLDADFEEIYSTIRNIIHKNINIKTKKTISRHIKQNWITRPILAEVKKRNELYKLHLKKKNSDTFNKFKKQRNLVNFLRTRARKKYETDLIEKANWNPRVLFSYLNKGEGNSTEILSIKENYKIYKDKNDLGNIFGKYFTRFKRRKDLKLPELSDPSTGVFQEITVEELLSIIDGLKNSCTVGEDMIPNYLIKKCRLFFAHFLAKFLNLAFRAGFVPQIWQTSTVWPKFKKGNRDELQSYRPISMISCVAKVGEKLMLKRVNEVITEKNLIPENQFGFRKNCSTLSNLVAANRYILENFELGIPTDVVYLDLSAAFDSVDQELLMEKLINMDFPHYIIKWLVNFICFRSIRVVINNFYSKNFKLECGVPQGCVLSATLFNLYLGDLTQTVSQLLLYADDFKILRQIKTSNDNLILQNDLFKIQQWCNNNYLDICSHKCEVIHMGKMNLGFRYIIKGEMIKSVDFHKDLDIHYDKGFSFDWHAIQTANKMRRIFGWCKNKIKYINLKGFKTIYKIFLQPILDYCSVGVTFSFEKDILLLENAFRSFTKRIHGFGKLNYKLRLEKLKLLSPRSRLIYNDLIYMYKEIVIKNNINELFIITGRDLRRDHRYQLKISYRKTNKMAKSIFCRRINTWNNLKNSCFAGNTLLNFKKNIFDNLILQ